MKNILCKVKEYRFTIVGFLVGYILFIYSFDIFYPQIYLPTLLEIRYFPYSLYFAGIIGILGFLFIEGHEFVYHLKKINLNSLIFTLGGITLGLFKVPFFIALGHLFKGYISINTFFQTIIDLLFEVISLDLLGGIFYGLIILTYSYKRNKKLVLIAAFFYIIIAVYCMLGGLTTQSI